MTTLPPIFARLPVIGAAPIDTTAAATYTNLNGLAALKRDPNSPQAISVVAQQVEALFLQLMLKSMRDATSAEAIGSNEMGMYQDMFDKQVALSISQHTDLGIRRLLKRQLQGNGSTAANRVPSDVSPSSDHAAAGSVALAATPAEFVHRVRPSVERAAGELGVGSMGILAQAALETGWGQRMPRNADGSSSNNLFGIKAGDEWTGARAAADTMEVIHGVVTARRVTFRSYASIEDSVSDFAHLLKHSPRYRDVVAAGGDTATFVARLGLSGYATDPEYAHKLNQILLSDTLQSTLTPRTAAL